MAEDVNRTESACDDAGALPRAGVFAAAGLVRTVDRLMSEIEALKRERDSEPIRAARLVLATAFVEARRRRRRNRELPQQVARAA